MDSQDRVQDIGAPVEPEAAVPVELSDSPAPEELTGRASKTEEDLEALFDNEGPDHYTDGFKGGSGDEPAVEGEPTER